LTDLDGCVRFHSHPGPAAACRPYQQGAEKHPEEAIVNKRPAIPALWSCAIAALLALPLAGLEPSAARAQSPAAVDLPRPLLDGTVSLEKALQERRSVRTFRDEPLELAEVGQLLWAAQGITEPPTGRRTAPSARALYPLNLYLLAGRVSGLVPGAYRYQPQGHRLARTHEGDKKAELYAAVGQASIRSAAAVAVLTGSTDRGVQARWIYLEGGHAAQNLLLQAQARGLGAVVAAGFKDEALRKVLDLPESEQPVYIIPLGRR
jgi:SagB-type dehydrogenase family enzyme